jgi:hypothetical protein
VTLLRHKISCDQRENVKNAEKEKALEAGGRWNPDLIEFTKRFFRASCADDTKSYVDKLKATTAARIRRAAPHDVPRAHRDGAPRQGLPLGGPWAQRSRPGHQRAERS